MGARQCGTHIARGTGRARITTTPTAPEVPKIPCQQQLSISTVTVPIKNLICVPSGKRILPMPCSLAFSLAATFSSHCATQPITRPCYCFRSTIRRNRAIALHTTCVEYVPLQRVECDHPHAFFDIGIANVPSKPLIAPSTRTRMTSSPWVDSSSASILLFGRLSASANILQVNALIATHGFTTRFQLH